MKIIADENISFATEAFSGFGTVELMHGRQITRSALKDADALVVRSITNVNRDLLEGTPVKFVGTATIGTDHIDKDYLHSQSITFTDAKGCNADAVTEYVFTALINTASKYGITLSGKTIGIAGIGNIGSRVAGLAEILGLNVLKNDPPLRRKTGNSGLVSLEEILKADFITFHVPLNKGGEDNTIHLLNSGNLQLLKEGAILINASRGQVADNTALTEVILKHKVHAVLDVWENEPDLNLELLKKVEIATPHIAGYSLEGKVNGTKIIYDALCRFAGLKNTWKPSLPAADYNIIEYNAAGNIAEDLNNIFNEVYNINRDNKELKEMLWMPGNERPAYFDLLRKNYPLRREFLNYKIVLKNSRNNELKNILQKFRFNVE
jgi:erythronate-4-phosphate dehydrogenase